MPVSVDLQKMFSYSLPLFVAVIAIPLVVIIVSLVVYLSSKKKPEKTVQRKVVQAAPPVIGRRQFRQKYLSQLDLLENSCRNQEIAPGKAYQNLSWIVRSFVYEMTGKRVQYATLEELKGADMPVLYEMIKECYVQEFSQESTCNIYDALHRARKVIQEWN